MVLVSASTGVAFTLPILESLLAERPSPIVRVVHVIAQARNPAHMDFFLDQVARLRMAARAAGITLTITVALTSGRAKATGDEPVEPRSEVRAKLEDSLVQDVDDDVGDGHDDGCRLLSASTRPGLKGDDPMLLAGDREGDEEQSDWDDIPMQPCGEDTEEEGKIRLTARPGASSVCAFRELKERVDLEAFITNTVSLAEGSVRVVAWGGRNLVAGVHRVVRRQDAAMLASGRISVFTEAYDS